MAEFLTVVCSRCGAKINAPPQYIGKRVKCPKCANPVEVVDPDEPLVPIHDEDAPVTMIGGSTEAAVPGSGGGEPAAPTEGGQERPTRFRKKGTSGLASVRGPRRTEPGRRGRGDEGARPSRFARPAKKSSTPLIVGIIVVIALAVVVLMMRKPGKVGASGASASSGAGGSGTTDPGGTAAGGTASADQPAFDAWLTKFAAYHLVNGARTKLELLQMEVEKYAKQARDASPDQEPQFRAQERKAREERGALDAALAAIKGNPFEADAGEVEAWRKKKAEGKVSGAALDGFCSWSGAQGVAGPQEQYKKEFLDEIGTDLSGDSASAKADRILARFRR